jgi:hypothetical protein
MIVKMKIVIAVFTESPNLFLNTYKPSANVTTIIEPERIRFSPNKNSVRNPAPIEIGNRKNPILRACNSNDFVWVEEGMLAACFSASLPRFLDVIIDEASVVTTQQQQLQQQPPQVGVATLALIFELSNCDTSRNM